MGGHSSKPDSVNYSNGVFTIGTMKRDEARSNAVTLPITVADHAVANEQCLTATLTGNPPPGTGPYDDDISDNVAKLCFVGASRLPSGEVSAFTLYPCVGITTDPCGSADDVRVRTTVPDHDGHILDSGTFVFHVPDHPTGSCRRFTQRQRQLRWGDFLANLVSRNHCLMHGLQSRPRRVRREAWLESQPIQRPLAT